MDPDSDIASDANDIGDLTENDLSDLDEQEDEGEVTDEDQSVKHFTHSSGGRGEASKGKAVRTQLGFWDGLLESRIKLQKPLSTCNALPQTNILQNFLKSADNVTKSRVNTVQLDLGQLLKELVELQQDVLEKNPVFSVEDTEHDEIEMDQEFSSALLHPVDHLDVVEKRLAQRHEKFRTFRNSTLEHWHSKTLQFSVGGKRGFAAFEQSPVKQIEQIMGDRNRLVQRTKVRRSTYEILGSAGTDQTAEVSGKNQPESQEIFDDDDFYHVLLRELIERKTASSSDDPLELSKQQVQLAQLRKRTKKVVDSKASRDRKLKMDPHPKLVNFMAPQPVCGVTEQARNDLFKSLFGKLLGGTAAATLGGDDARETARGFTLLRT